MNFLCIGAHPDDVELSMGGTILVLKSRGHEVTILDLTNGEPTPFGNIEIRKKESENAAKILGVERITLDLKNRFLEDDVESRKKIAEIIRKLKPEYLFTHFSYDSHPDHIAAANLTDASRFYSKLTKSDIPGEPHFPGKIFYYFPNHIRLNLDPCFVVDISEFIEKKKECLHSYDSQFIKKGNGTVIEDAIAINRYYGIRIGEKYAEPFYSRESLDIIKLGRLFA